MVFDSDEGLGLRLGNGYEHGAWPGVYYGEAGQFTYNFFGKQGSFLGKSFGRLIDKFVIRSPQIVRFLIRPGVRSMYWIKAALLGTGPGVHTPVNRDGNGDPVCNLYENFLTMDGK